MTQHQPQLVPMLLRRRELRPNHAYVLFWWADSDCRRLILQRFAVSREVLQEAAGDVFPMAAEEHWQDDLTRKALQFIERRQRNRAAIEKSPFSSLEEAITVAEQGLSREIAEEIAYLAGIKPMTGAKIMTDDGGEGLAVLCKATGLPRSALRSLWRALRRPETTEDGQPAPALTRVTTIYDMVAVDRAQTVLRYWNWSLSSAMTPSLMKAIREDDDTALDEFSVRSARQCWRSAPTSSAEPKARPNSPRNRTAAPHAVRLAISFTDLRCGQRNQEREAHLWSRLGFYKNPPLI